MGNLGIPELFVLILIMAIPVSLVVGGVVYLVRLARNGPAKTRTDAARRREFPS